MLRFLVHAYPGAVEVTNNERRGKLPGDLSWRGHTWFMKASAYLSRYVLRHGELCSVPPIPSTLTVTTLFCRGAPDLLHQHL